MTLRREELTLYRETVAELQATQQQVLLSFTAGLSQDEYNQQVGMHRGLEEALSILKSVVTRLERA